MLMQMRALTAAARTICYAAAGRLDVSVRLLTPRPAALRRPARSAHANRKGISTDMATRYFLGVQVLAA